MKTCPRCQQELRAAEVASVKVEECPACKGLWFEDQELRLTKDRTDADLAWLDFDIWKHPERFQRHPRAVPCPSCRPDRGMVGVQYGSTGVTIDCCENCHGMWLDRGELDRIVAALTEELDEKDVGDYLRASVEEARELFTGSESLGSEWRDLRSVLHLLQLRFFVDNPKLLSFVRAIPPA
jgi:Zn-finger nucleic acid-binding protein